MKKLWIAPQITEIGIKATKGDNKVGTSTDQYTNTLDLCGEITPCGDCS